MTARRFKVVFEHDDGGWHVYLPEVKGCRTWGRSLIAARKNIREALATCEDVFEDAERVAREAIFVEDVRVKAAAVLAKLKALNVKREQVERAFGHERARAATALTKEGLSLRDAGELLGVSQEQVRNVLASRGARSSERS